MSTHEAGFAHPPVDDELDTDILPLRRRRRLPLLTALLAVAAIAAGAFAGGVEIQKHYGDSGGSSSTAGSAASALTGARAAGGSSAFSRSGTGGGFFTRGAGSGGATAGLVTLIRGSTLYVTDFSGNTVKVSTRGARITKTTTAKSKSIHPGDSVVVRGTTQKNGSMRASTITLGAGGFGGGNG